MSIGCFQIWCYFHLIILSILVETYVAAFGAPPIGAKYVKEIGLPVLGNQMFSLKVLNENYAHLLVTGLLNLDEIVAYSVTSRGHLSFRLSENAERQLRTFRASLKEVGYNLETDTPYVKVKTPLPVLVKINFKRRLGKEANEKPMLMPVE